MGGSLNMNIFTKSSFKKTHDSNAITDQAELAFGTAIQDNLGPKARAAFGISNEKKKDSEFDRASNINKKSFVVEGGGPTLGNWETWLPTIAELPAVIDQVKFNLFILHY